MLVDPERLDPGEPARLGDASGGLRADPGPGGVPVDAKVAGDRGDSGVVVPQRIDRPGDPPGGELRPLGRIGVTLGPRRHRAGLLGAAPDPLAPPHHHRSHETRGVMQAYDPTAMADRDDTTRNAAHDDLVSLDVKHHRAVVTAGGVEDMNPVDTKKLISPSAPRHTGTTHTVGHVRVFSTQLLGRC